MRSSQLEPNIGRGRMPWPNSSRRHSRTAARHFRTLRRHLRSGPSPDRPDAARSNHLAGPRRPTTSHRTRLSNPDVTVAPFRTSLTSRRKAIPEFWGRQLEPPLCHRRACHGNVATVTAAGSTSPSARHRLSRPGRSRRTLRTTPATRPVPRLLRAFLSGQPDESCRWRGGSRRDPACSR